jgi:hypothetical protein
MRNPSLVSVLILASAHQGRAGGCRPASLEWHGLRRATRRPGRRGD